jgi:5-methylcytosine-specific restriction endonuclease McrA
VGYQSPKTTPVGSWRQAILLGRNSRTYKFALGAALLEVAQGGERRVSLEDLARPYAVQLARHATRNPQAPTASVSGPEDFLAVLKRDGAQTLDLEEPTDDLLAAAVHSMPAMVMQKFHNLAGRTTVDHEFYAIRGSGSRRFVELGEPLFGILERRRILGEELEARWEIVEACFDDQIGPGLVQEGVVLSDDGEQLLGRRRRVAVTRARDALSGFQGGRCFYCQEPFSALSSQLHVDHVFPVALMAVGGQSMPDLNGLWNLVLACAPCNLRKSSRLPTVDEIARLIDRNEVVMQSPFPLRKTLDLAFRSVSRGGATTRSGRRAFITAVDRLARQEL